MKLPVTESDLLPATPAPVRLALLPERVAPVAAVLCVLPSRASSKLKSMSLDEFFPLLLEALLADRMSAHLEKEMGCSSSASISVCLDMGR